MKWYRKAAEQGHAEAQQNLGVMYANGQGVAEDYGEAMKWYLKAAEQGDAHAQSILGFMYSEGQGVSQDYVRAYMWLSLAAKRDHEDAKYDRAVVGGKLTKDQIAEAERLAREWLEEHCE